MQREELQIVFVGLRTAEGREKINPSVDFQTIEAVSGGSVGIKAKKTARKRLI